MGIYAKNNDEWYRVGDDGLALPDAGGGKVLQVVQTATKIRPTTTNTSYEDTGISVTITPKKSGSTIFLRATGFARSTRGVDGTHLVRLRITDDSSNPIPGAEQVSVIEATNFSGTGDSAFSTNLSLLACEKSTGAATTYKLQFHTVAGCIVDLRGDQCTNLFTAIELEDVVVSP